MRLLGVPPSYVIAGMPLQLTLPAASSKRQCRPISSTPAGQLSNVMGCLTTYGIGSAPPFYGTGYVPQVGTSTNLPRMAPHWLCGATPLS